METLVIWSLVAILGLRILPWLVRFLPRRLRQHSTPMAERLGALLDIAGGTLMLAIVVALLFEQAWIAAGLFAVLTLPTARGTISGWRRLRALRRSPRI